MTISISEKLGTYCSLYNIDNSAIEAVKNAINEEDFPPNSYSYAHINPNIGGWWYYTRCAVNYDAREMYLQAKMNYGEPYKTKKPSESKNIISEKNGNNFPYEKLLYKIKNNSWDTDISFRKYFRNTDKSSFKIITAKNGGGAVITSVYAYLKNLYIFNDYIPKDMNFQYWSFHAFIAANDFNSFTFAIPFDEFDISSGHVLHYYIKPYQKAERLSFTWTASGTPEYNFPIGKKNFYRLNLLKGANLKYQTREANPNKVAAITCTGNNKYCFDDNKAYICKNGYVLDLATYTCISNCISNRVAQFGDTMDTNPSSGLCQNIKFGAGSLCAGYTCSQNAVVCLPTALQFFTTCIEKTDDILTGSDYYRDTVKRSAMYYGYKYTPPAINIYPGKLSQFSNMKWFSYAIEFFWFPDLRKETFRYTNNNSEAINHIFFSNIAQIYHKDIKDETYEIKRPGSSAVGGFHDYVNVTGWNKFTIYVEYIPPNYNHHFIVNNHEVTLTNPNSEGPIEFISFCHNDSFPTCEGDNFKWSSGYYRNLRLWNGSIYKINLNMILNYSVYDEL